MYKLIILFCLITTVGISQTIRPVCDEALEIPYSFTYSGFIIQDSEVVKADNYRIKLDIVQDSIEGQLLYSETFNIPFTGSSFFSVEIPRLNVVSFNAVIRAMNDNQNTPYFIKTYLRDDAFEYNFVGAKSILTVPYAMVANSLGGLGPQGPSGPQGPQGFQGSVGIQCLPGNTGAQGPSGPPGADGLDNFGNMKMTNMPPNDASVYIDDGSNTQDGAPHIRYKLNGVWIDL